MTGMEYGGITPIGLPADWRILVDDLVAKSANVVIGAGIRGAKLWLPGGLLAELPGAEILPGLGVEAGSGRLAQRELYRDSQHGRRDEQVEDLPGARCREQPRGEPGAETESR